VLNVFLYNLTLSHNTSVTDDDDRQIDDNSYGRTLSSTVT